MSERDDRIRSFNVKKTIQIRSVVGVVALLTWSYVTFAQTSQPRARPKAQAFDPMK